MGKKAKFNVVKQSHANKVPSLALCDWRNDKITNKKKKKTKKERQTIFVFDESSPLQMCVRVHSMTAYVRE